MEYFYPAFVRYNLVPYCNIPLGEYFGKKHSPRLEYFEISVGFGGYSGLRPSYPPHPLDLKILP